MTKNYRWYDIVEGDQLQQGDFIDLCPVVEVPAEFINSNSSEDEENGVPAHLSQYNVVILSHSCDLAIREGSGKASLEFVLVCPVWPLNDFAEKIDFFKSSDAKEALRRGYQPAYHLLNECKIDKFKRPVSVVDFKSVYSVGFDAQFNAVFKKARWNRSSRMDADMS